MLALLLEDLLAKERRGNELMFTDNVMHILWLDNSDTDDKFVFSEAYGDDRNSLYTIIDRVRIDEIITDASGLRSYKLPQEETDRIGRLLKGGDNSALTLTRSSSKMKKCPMRIRLMNLLNLCFHH